VNSRCTFRSAGQGHRGREKMYIGLVKDKIVANSKYLKNHAEDRADGGKEYRGRGKVSPSEKRRREVRIEGKKLNLG